MDTSDACRLIINLCIPLYESMIKAEHEPKSLVALWKMYKQMFCFAGRRSLRHFMLFYEWDWEQGKKLLENRPILDPFVFYLSKIPFDPKLTKIVASYMPSAGKSRTVCYYEAWRFGLDASGAILRISYNDTLVKGFSRAVIDIIKSEQFGEVFPELSYQQRGRKLFGSETDETWRLADAALNASYYARTNNSGITGVRASLSIDLDDVVKNAKEAENPQTHEEFWLKWQTEIENRKSGSGDIDIVVVGTKWSPEDFICRLVDNEKKRKHFVQDPRFKFVEIAEDGSTVIISVPSLDPDTDESTCEFVETTKKLHELREDLDEYNFSCVYQQDPIPVAGRIFAKENLQFYDKLPRRSDGTIDLTEYAFAVVDPPRRGKNYLSMPILRRCDSDGLYYLVDVLYVLKSINDCHEDIVNKVILHRVSNLSIENNTDASLRKFIEHLLNERHFVGCSLTEKYQTHNKEARIRDSAGSICKNIVFPASHLYAGSSEMGQFMATLTKYTFDKPAQFDDAPDSLALFNFEMILGRGKPAKATPVSRKALGF